MSISRYVEGDYESDSYTVVFQPGQTSAELRIPILDDSLGVEGTEDFFATLSISASSVYLGVSAGSVDSVTVSILDDDNVTVECIMSEYEVSPLHISQKYVLGIMGFRCPSSTYH